MRQTLNYPGNNFSCYFHDENRTKVSAAVLTALTFTCLLKTCRLLLSFLLHLPHRFPLVDSHRTNTRNRILKKGFSKHKARDGGVSLGNNRMSEFLCIKTAKNESDNK